MESSDRKRMIQLGEWLEIYLDPSSTHCKYRELAEFFIKYYNIDFELRDNDLTLEFVLLLAEQDETISQQYSNRKLRNKTFGPWFLNDVYTELEDPLQIIKFIDSARNKAFYINGTQGSPKGLVCSSTLHEDWESKAESLIFNLFDSIDLIKGLFHQINLSEYSYLKSISEKHEGEDLYDHFVNSYGKISTTLYENAESLFAQSTLTKGFSSSIPIIPSIFPWMTASSYIFFDFLILGGQEHFRFCDNCGRFTVVKRKGKKFCSDICRTEFNRVNIK